MKNPEDISKKIKSYAHSEYNKKEFSEINIIKEKINNKKDIFNRNINYKKVELNDSFPEYILENLKKYEDWII